MRTGCNYTSGTTAAAAVLVTTGGRSHGRITIVLGWLSLGAKLLVEHCQLFLMFTNIFTCNAKESECRQMPPAPLWTAPCVVSYLPTFLREKLLAISLLYPMSAEPAFG